MIGWVARLAALEGCSVGIGDCLENADWGWMFVGEKVYLHL